MSIMHPRQLSRLSRSALTALLRLMACGLLLGVTQDLKAAPIIAEFQASNKGTLQDEDGDTSDWIEIYNPDDAPVNLEGLSLTDKADQPQLWIFPAYTIQPGESLIVWASGKDRRDPAGSLHTNFNLSADGEYLALVATDAAARLSEFNPFPPQLPGRAFGQAPAVMWEDVLVAGATCKWKAPDEDIPNWDQPGFDDSKWQTASTGLGYDVVRQDVDYMPLIGQGGDLETSMHGLRPTCLVRIPFSVTNTRQIVAIKLRIRYDSGFAVFLNGVRLTPPTPEATNAPESLTYNSEAPDARVDSEALLVEEFNLSQHTHLLNEGENLLCFQLLSHTITDTGSLIIPELSVALKTPDAPSQTGFFAVPTPGFYNSETVYQGFAESPNFSLSRNFLSEPKTLTLSTATPDAQIRYTTNGSVPDEAKGTLYKQPIKISTTQVVRAQAFRTSWHPSPIISHTYIFPKQVVRQPNNPSGLPTTWGWDENGHDLDPEKIVPSDYAMDQGVTQAPAYKEKIIPALTTTLPVLSLSLPTEHLFSLTGMYANGRIQRVEKPASVEYFDPNSGQTFYENAGMRIHGGNTPNEHPKKPFRIFFRKRYGGKGELEFPLYPGSPVEQFDVLQLRPGGHDGWSVPFGSGDGDLARHATYLRDRFLRQTELDMGRLSPRGRYVHLYLNGLYWGVYDLHEVPKEEFFSDHLGGKKEDWDVLEHGNTGDWRFDVVDGSSSAMEELLNLCRPPEAMESMAKYQKALSLLDIDDFIDHLIIQIWGANNDWMGPVFLGTGNVSASRFFNKNWQAGRRSRGKKKGGFHWTVWDAEISLGSNHTDQVGHQREVNFDHTRIGTPELISKVPGIPGPPAEIYNALRYNSAFRQRFADRLQKHLFQDGELTPERNLARLKALQEELHLALVAESARWGDVNSGKPDVVTFTPDEHWRAELDWIKETYIPQRNAILLNQFAALGIWPSITAPIFSAKSEPAESKIELEIHDPAEQKGKVFYTLDGTDPMQADQAVSTTAIPYESVLSLSKKTTLKARILKDQKWSPLTEGSFIPGSNAPAKQPDPEDN